MYIERVGSLFETLVLAEIVKFINNTGKDWELFFGRTKDGQEVDFIIKTANNQFHVLEAKYAIHGVTRALSIPQTFSKELSPKSPLVVVTSGGQQMKLGNHCMTCPISELYDYLDTI